MDNAAVLFKSAGNVKLGDGGTGTVSLNASVALNLTGSDITVSATNNLELNTGSLISISADNTITVVAAEGDIDLTANIDLNASAANNVNLTAGSTLNITGTSVLIAGTNTTVSGDLRASTATGFITFVAGTGTARSIQLNNEGSMTLQAASTSELRLEQGTTTNRISLNTGGIDITAASQTNELDVTITGSDLLASTSNNITLNAGSDVNISPTNDLTISAGGDINIDAGDASGSSAGGTLSFTGGAGGASGANSQGGDILFLGGSSFSTSAGNIEIRGGETKGTSSDRAGGVLIHGGNSTGTGDGDGGPVIIRGGQGVSGDGDVNAGDVEIYGGAVDTGGNARSGGHLLLSGGVGSTLHAGGSVLIIGGSTSATNRDAGTVRIEGGQSASGSAGSVNISGGAGSTAGAVFITGGIGTGVSSLLTPDITISTGTSGNASRLATMTLNSESDVTVSATNNIALNASAGAFQMTSTSVRFNINGPAGSNVWLRSSTIFGGETNLDTIKIMPLGNGTSGAIVFHESTGTFDDRITFSFGGTSTATFASTNITITDANFTVTPVGTVAGAACNFDGLFQVTDQVGVRGAPVKFQKFNLGAVSTSTIYDIVPLDRPYVLLTQSSLTAYARVADDNGVSFNIKYSGGASAFTTASVIGTIGFASGQLAGSVRVDSSVILAGGGFLAVQASTVTASGTNLTDFAWTIRARSGA
jgi:uncharacterized protein (DUF2345 family)